MPLGTWLSKIEANPTVDRLAQRLEAVARPLGRNGRRRDLLSGRPLGHPAHPATVALPLGTWLSASALDLTVPGGTDVAARRLIGLGIAGALPAAACGASDWLDTAGAERRVGAVHAVVNVAALGAMTASWVLRRRGRRGAGTALALAGNGIAGIGGWLGGHLAYRLGVGVNTTAFQAGPVDWTPVLDDAAVRPGKPVAAWAGGAAVVIVEDGGELHALENRCTHRGGPLHQGEVSGGCLSCPWHGSVFALADGAVRQGPATMPQPVYEVRRRDGRAEVRRQEAVALRANPTASERPLRSVGPTSSPADAS
jgi:nitrite reductase/ring-hydroxylating ferredoxin subunit/uncharacterized membrane protein